MSVLQITPWNFPLMGKCNSAADGMLYENGRSVAVLSVGCWTGAWEQWHYNIHAVTHIVA